MGEEQKTHVHVLEDGTVLSILMESMYITIVMRIQKQY